MVHGEALEWFHWMKSNSLLRSWDDFLQQVKFRFDPVYFEDFTVQFPKLHQAPTVTAYQAEYEKLSSLTPNEVEVSKSLIKGMKLKSDNGEWVKVVKDGIGMLSNLMRGWEGGRRNMPMVGQKRIASEITVKHSQWVAPGRERGCNEKGNYYLQRKEIIVSNVCMDSHTCLADCEDGITVTDQKRRRTVIDGACIDGLTGIGATPWPIEESVDEVDEAELQAALEASKKADNVVSFSVSSSSGTDLLPVSVSPSLVSSGGFLLTGLHLSPRRSTSEIELGGDLFWKAAGSDGVKEDYEDGRRLLKLQDDGVRCHHSSQQSDGDVLPPSAGIVAE
nr:DNA (cytosine-5)-methyltransferase 1 [Ipomoea batatas]